MTMMRVLVTMLRALVLAVCLTVCGRAQDTMGALDELPLSRLSDSRFSPLGLQALAIQPSAWRHAESEHFIYHFQHNFVAAPVSTEAEAYYRFVAKDLSCDTAGWERKSHVYIFEVPEDWRAFQSSAQLDPWTGGIHAGGDLFIVRNPAFKFKGHSLAHEITHLVIFRFFGNGVPLWLNEGTAENAGRRAYATFYRARGYHARPGSEAMAEADFIPLSVLTGDVSYPADPKMVARFYQESERLVRFLMNSGKPQFRTMLDALGQGRTLESALEKGYGGRFSDLPALEQAFKPVATREFAQSSAE